MEEILNLHNEHLNVDKTGKILGLYKINASAVLGVDIWQKIERTIIEYTKLHPLEVELVLRENKFLTETRLNDFATSGKKGMANLRWGCNIPVALMFLLEEIEPKLFANPKLYHKFLNKFKGFRICKKV